MSRVRELSKKQRVAIYFMAEMGKSLCDIASYYDISANEVIKIIRYYQAKQEKTCSKH